MNKTTLVKRFGNVPAHFEFEPAEDSYLPASDTQDWCEQCGRPQDVIGVHEEQSGYEEQAQYFTVTDLRCGHEIVSGAR